MRITGGEFRSRPLKAVSGLAVRPTSDKLRETLFNILGGKAAGSVWYDCFAGSGAVGLEALSRGALFVVFIESSRAAAHVLRANVGALAVEHRCEIIEQPVAKALASRSRATRPADFVFLDPPYGLEVEYAKVLNFLGKEKLLRPEGVAIAEHARRDSLEARYGALARYRVLEQGDSALSFYRSEVP